MIAAEGILTARGGVSSHAALVARQMGKVCVCGAAAVEVDYQARTVTVDGQTFKEGDWMSIDGTAGKVYAGQVKTAPSEIVAGLIDGDAGREEDREVQELPAADEVVRRGHADGRAHQRRHAGADAERDRVRRRRHRPVPHRAHVLRGRPHRRDARDDPRRDARGAEGGARQAAAVSARGLRRHLPRAQGPPGDDPLPRSAAARVPAAHAGTAGGPGEEARRAGRAGFTRASSSCTSSTRCSASAAAVSASAIPEISAMQARAVFEAAAIVQKEGIKVQPEIMIPLVGFKKELDLQLEVVHQAAREVQAEQKVKLNYMVGTMIEIPRGALTADEIAQSAEFFSFGTNDLTQTALGHVARRLGVVPAALRRARDREEEPVRHDRHRRRRPARRDRRDQGTRRRGQDIKLGHLRRARRRPLVDSLLREGRPRLRELLAVPRARRAAGRGAGGVSASRAGPLESQPASEARRTPPRSHDHRLRLPERRDEEDGPGRAAMARSGIRTSRSGWISCSPPRRKGSNCSPTRFTSIRCRSRTRSARSTIPKVEPYRRLPLRRSSTASTSRGASTSSPRATSTSSSATTISSPCTTAARAASRSCKATLRAARAHPRGRPRRADAPHRRLDGRQLRAGDRRSSKSRWTSSRRRPSSAPATTWCGRFSRSSATSPRCAASLIPQRDVVGRLARREFPQISDEMAYRFRDVYDHLVRLPDEAMMFQDRVTGILEGYLSAISNRLNQVMKVLTVMSTIFLPLTVLTGMWGMNVRCRMLPGGERRAVLVDHRDHGRDQRGDAGALPPQALDLSRHGQDSSAPARPRQPDCRRRGRRAAGVGHQGAGRELDRCRRASHRDHRRARRQEADSRRRRRRGDGRRRMRGWPSSAMRRARSAVPTTSSGSPRSASAARRCRASRRSRISRCGRRARGADSGTEVRVNGGARRVGDGSRDAGRHRRSKSPTCSTTCRRGGSF